MTIVKGRFTLDTNVLVYAVDRDGGERHRRSMELVGRAAERDCVLMLQALAEFYHATTRKNLLGASDAGSLVRDWLEVFEIASADREALADAMSVVDEHRLSFWDAMLWATARQAGCSAIVSEDMQHGRRLGGVEFVNPFSPQAVATMATLLDA
ncbi:MAG: PIN domain-containing protein [Defluviicoccus sp.]|nr:PIN domain-containing protein [Defluviicoccus sp.]